MSIGVRPDGVFFAARANGDVELFKLPAFDALDRVHFPQAIHRLAYVDAERAVVIESRNSTLRLLDALGRSIAQVALDYQALDLRTFGGDVYVLSRGGNSTFVYDGQLRLKSEIHLEAKEIEQQTSCNFIQPVKDAIFISCEEALLKFAMDGKFVAKTDVWAVRRGLAEIHAFDEQTLRFKRRYKVEDEAGVAIWTNIGKTGNLVYALDYVANEIKLFEIVD
ncbi:hypothetical protein M3Y99_00416300 [Aphelenchoides fujianensis]|nr:hypothetical protein M3Y99_00416300 [Aphelenchoides fujianensis]